MRVLLNTVGTSVLNIWKELGAALDEAHHTALVRALSHLSYPDRRLGAELASIQSLLRQERVALGDRLVFLVSDTPEGRFVGDALARVTQEQGFPTEVKPIPKLQGADPKAFQQGLRNLVRVIAALYQAHSAEGRMVLINATGGYKAQISFAGIIGQVFQVPVFYQFETFPQAIELPPLPVDFAMDQWLGYRHILEDLESGPSLIPAHDERLKTLPESLRVLLDVSQGYVALNPLGTLYHHGFWSRFAAQAQELVPRPSGMNPAHKKISYEDDNPGKHRGLADWLTRISQVPFVTRIQTFYYNPALPGRSDFEPDPTAPDRVIGWYCAHGATTKSYIFLSEDDFFKAKVAATDLARQFER